MTTSSGRWSVRTMRWPPCARPRPPPRTVFLLCTPSTPPDDIAVTLRSRCRVVTLRQPSAEAVASVLVERDRIAHGGALWAAAAAQGHVGRARRLARDPQARARRDAVLAVPRRLTGVGPCFDAANALIEAAEAEAVASVSEVDSQERSALETALGAGGTGRGAAGAVRGAAGAPKDLGRGAKARGPGGPAGARGPGAGGPGRGLPRGAGPPARRPR